MVSRVPYIAYLLGGGWGFMILKQTCDAEVLRGGSLHDPCRLVKSLFALVMMSLEVLFFSRLSYLS